MDVQQTSSSGSSSNPPPVKGGTKVRPTNVGNHLDIPDDICILAQLDRIDVIAWTTLDTKYQPNHISRITCCQTFGRLFFCPCFWLHLIILFPCLLAEKVSAEHTMKYTYWILTATELKVVIREHHGGGCIPGCYHIDDPYISIPYSNITDCGVIASNSGDGCVESCTAIPTICVDTVRSTETSSIDGDSPGHKVIGYGLAGDEWFITEIIARRDEMKRRLHHLHHHHHHHQQPKQEMVIPNVDHDTIIVASNDSAESRLKQVEELRTNEMINGKEYETKRQEIIASL
jgi:hypothetical protein